MFVARLVALSFFFLVVSAICYAEQVAIDPNLASPSEDGTMLWYDARLLTIEGQGWSNTKSAYVRFPSKAEERVRPDVWNLSRTSAGIVVRFTTAAPAIQARWTLNSTRLALPHMPATGVSGIDLYVRDTERRWHWLANGRPTEQTNLVELVSGLTKETRDYLLYLPLYNGVTSVEIGLAKEHSIAATGARPEGFQKPIVFYGTSITQGACASRPGMVHTAILGRRFDRPVINLGFSGNGRMETEVVELIAEIDAAVYVLDCLPNLEAEAILARTKPCVEILRASRPDTPILFVEDRSYSDSFLVGSKRERNRTNREAFRTVFDELRAAGNMQLYYLEGERLLGDDNEGTVDSSHPNDLGFWRQANVFEEALRPILFGGDR